MTNNILEKGIILKNKYQILKLWKKTGISIIYLAEEIDTKNIVIIKQPNTVSHVKIKYEKLKNEANILSKLNHPNIVQYIDSWEGEDYIYYLVLKFVEGENMHNLFKNSPPPLINTREYILNLLDILSYLHKKNIIHKDIKPENLIISDGITLIDFGAATISPQNNFIKNIKIGTPGYQCPEITKGSVDFTCDIYSVGATLYFLLTGKRPNFLTRELQLTQLNNEYVKIINKAMNNEKKDRYSNTQEMKDDILNKFPKTFRPFLFHDDKIFVINKKLMKIGRSEFADIKITDSNKYVSPFHADIFIDNENSVWIQDISKNGIYIYENYYYKKIVKRILKDEDLIVLCYNPIKGPYKRISFRQY